MCWLDNPRLCKAPNAHTTVLTEGAPLHPLVVNEGKASPCLLQNACLMHCPMHDAEHHASDMIGLIADEQDCLAPAEALASSLSCLRHHHDAGQCSKASQSGIGAETFGTKSTLQQSILAITGNTDDDIDNASGSWRNSDITARWGLQIQAWAVLTT